MRKISKRISDLKVNFVSLVKRGANKTAFSIIKTENDETYEFNLNFLKQDEKMIVTGLVYAPNTLDSHGHFMKEEDIESAAHSFMESQAIDKQHNFEKENCKLVESWIAKEDCQLNGTEIKKGSWLMSVKINDDSIWQDVKKGEITGFSLAGKGKLTDETIKKGDDTLEKELKKAEEQLENIKKDFEEFKKSNGETAITALIAKQIEPIEKALEEEKKKGAKESEVTKEALLKAEKLIKELQNGVNVVKSGQELSSNDIAGALGEAVVHLCKSGSRENITFDAILSQIEKSDNVIVKALNTTDQASTVKPFYMMKILEKVLEVNPIAKEIPFINITDGSIFIPKESSGYIGCDWIDESGSRAETTGITTTNVEIKIWQIYAMPKITNKLLGTNFVDLGNFLMMRIQSSISQKISDTVLFGTGSANSQPTGIFENTVIKAALIPIIGSEFTGTDGVLDKFLSATHSLITAYDAGSKWYMNKQTWAKILSLKDGNGAYLYNTTGAISKADQKLWGFEVVFNNSLPAFDDITVTGTPFALFGNVAMGMYGAKNNKLNMNITDQITEKGFTKMYVESGLGFEVVDEQAFVGMKYVAPTP